MEKKGEEKKEKGRPNKEKERKKEEKKTRKKQDSLPSIARVSLSVLSPEAP